MSLDDYLVPSHRRVNICFDCQKACGDCSWTELNTNTGKPRFEPVPGWTAEPVVLNLGFRDGERQIMETYHITACPEFVQDEKRKVYPEDMDGGAYG